jgi:Ser/Thr protein kinase RdoA (MazF antagonist)
MKGVLDRFEDNKAVILIENTKEELIMDRSLLPAESSVNTYFTLKKKNEEYIITKIDKEATEQQAQKSSELMKKLRNKSSGSKFKKN